MTKLGLLPSETWGNKATNAPVAKMGDYKCLLLQGARAWPLSGPQSSFFPEKSCGRCVESGNAKGEGENAVCLALLLPEVVNVGKKLSILGFGCCCWLLNGGPLLRNCILGCQIFVLCLICLECEISIFFYPRLFFFFRHFLTYFLAYSVLFGSRFCLFDLGFA